MSESKPKILLSFVGNNDPLSSDPRPFANNKENIAKEGILASLKKFLPWPVEKKGSSTSNAEKPSLSETYEINEKTEGNIVAICREIQPSKIYLFPSQANLEEITKEMRDSSIEELFPVLFPISGKIKMNNTEINAIAVKKYLLWKNVLPALREEDIHIMSLEISDATDTPSIHSRLKNIISNEILQNFPKKELDNFDFCFNNTSGTPQMRETARLYFSTSPINVQFYKCRNPKHMKPTEKRVDLDDAPLIEEVALLDRINSNAEKYHFYTIVEDCNRLKEISVLPERQTIAGILAKAFGAYHQMDQMQYGKAYAEISEIFNSEIGTILTSRNRSIMRSPFEFFEEQHVFLNKVKDDTEQENCYNLTDLYFNMHRAFARQNYADVLARFWRLREGMLYFRLNSYGIDIRTSMCSDPKNPQKSANYDKLAKSDKVNITNKIEKPWFKKPWTLKEDNIIGYERILTAFFDDGILKKSVAKDEKRLRNLKDSRNHIFIAHGMSPVKKEDAEACLNLGKDLLPLISGSNEIHDTYPFTKEKLKTIVDLLIDV